MSQYPHTATYWGSPSPDGYGGFSFASPVLLSPDSNSGVRWQDRVEIFVDESGQESRSQSVIYPQQELPVNGWLARGDETSESDPTAVDSARPIRQAAKSDNLKGTETIYKVWL